MPDEMDFSWDEIKGENLDPVPAAAAEPTPEVTPPVESDPPAPPAEPEPPADPPATTDEPAEPEDPTAKGRFRLEGKAAHFARLVREGVDEQEAIKIAYKDAPQGSEPAPSPPSDPLKAIDEELEQLAQILDPAAADESLNTPEYRKATRREAELLAKKEVLETRQREAAEAQRQQETQNLQTTEAKAWEAAETTYPQIKDEASPLFKSVEKEWNEIAGNPKHPLYSVPDLPELLTAKHASKLGIAPAKASSPTPTPATPPPAKGLQTVPGDTGRSAPLQNLTSAQLEAQSAARLAKASDAEIDDILDTDLWGKPKDERESSFSFRF
jgi:hypothetical protein